MNDYFDLFLANIYKQDNVAVSNKYFKDDTVCNKDAEENCYL
jgi:hypothetical protein